MKTILILIWISNLTLSGQTALVKISSYLNDTKNQVTESGMLPERTPEAEEFVIGLSKNWKLVVDSLPKYANDGRSQSLLAVGAEFFQPREYLEFIDAICDRAILEDGGVTDELLTSFILARMIKVGFLAYHYEHEDVSPIITKLKFILMSRMPDQWDTFFTSIESGEMRLTVIDERQRYEDQLPEGLDDPGVLKGK